MKNKIFGRAIVVACIATLITAKTSVKAFTVEGNSSNTEVSLNSSNQIQLPEDKSIINTQIMPGDVIQQTFYVSNQSSQIVGFYMSSNMEVTDVNGNAVVTVDGKSFAKDLVSKIQLTLAREDGTILYQGPCSGKLEDATKEYKINFPTASISDGFMDFNKKEGIGLGTLEAGTSMRLIATLSVPGEAITNEYQNVYSLFNWEFYCEGEDVVIPPYYPPVVSPETSPKVSPSPTPEVPIETEIPDGEVPGDGGQGDIGDEDGDGSGSDSIHIIEDEEVPLDDIPVIVNDKDVKQNQNINGLLAKTGFSALYIKQALSVLVILMAGLFVVNKLRKKKRS